MTEILGYIGTVLVFIAYLPQIYHLIKGRCSAAISLWSWWIWLVAGILILSHAITGDDPVFIVLTVLNLTFTTIIIILATLYHKNRCQVNHKAK